MEVGFLLDMERFTLMLLDKAFFKMDKMQHKYGKEDFMEFIEVLRKSLYKFLPIKDFAGNFAALLPGKINLTSQMKKELLKAYPGKKIGLEAMEKEIISTLTIERIESTRESVGRILMGGAPLNENEKKAYGIKRGIDYISDQSNKINKENLHELYRISVGEYLEESDLLPPYSYYRGDTVFIVGDRIMHEGLYWKLLPQYMDEFIKYINTDDELDQIVKSIIIHYYFAYMHPYFDGNGRMARLLQFWYLIQNGYSHVLYIPFSKFINDSRGEYYKTFSQISLNFKISGILDVTPFILYFIENVFLKLGKKTTAASVFSKIEDLLSKGLVTVKEKELIHFVISKYGQNEFSTKQLEKDFGNAAYATIRSFVMKFELHDVLEKSNYGHRVRYRIKQE